MAGAKRHGHARFPAHLNSMGKLDAQMTISNDRSAAGGLRTPTGSDKKEIDQRSGHSVRGSRSRLCNAHLNCCCNSGHSYGNVVVDQVPSDSDWLVVPKRRRRSRRIRGAVVDKVVHENLDNDVDTFVVLNHLGQIGAQDADAHEKHETHENETEGEAYMPSGR